MGSENGRGFVGDRERFTATERRDKGRLDERAEAAGKRVVDGEATLKRFEAQLGEAFLEKKNPPQAAVDLQRQLTEARQTIAACEAVRPEKVRALEAREQEWREKARPQIEARIREVVEGGSTAAQQYKEWEAARTAVFADIKHAAPWFPLPELPVLAPKLDYVLETLRAYPPRPAAPSGLIAVRLTAQPPKALKQGHRLGDAVTAARARLQLERYGPDDTFGISPQYAELLDYLGLERATDQPHEAGATP